LLKKEDIASIEGSNYARSEVALAQKEPDMEQKQRILQTRTEAQVEARTRTGSQLQNSDAWRGSVDLKVSKL